LQKEVITDKQGIVLVILFAVGSAVILIPGLQAKKDAWLAVALAVLITLPVTMMYARLMYLFPGYDLFDILNSVFGKIIGKFISIMFIWFAFHLGTLVMYNFGIFIETVGLTMTPMIIPIACIAILSAWGVKEGIEVLGRWGEFFLPIVMILFALSSLLLIPKMDINQIKPILYEGVKPLLKGTFSLFSFPFAETVIFTMVFYSLKNKRSSFKIYTAGIVFTGIMGILMTLTIILVLGANIASEIYFPSYAAISRLSVGNFLQMGRKTD
jgi:spore germination protein KB